MGFLGSAPQPGCRKERSRVLAEIGPGRCCLSLFALWIGLVLSSLTQASAAAQSTDPQSLLNKAALAQTQSTPMRLVDHGIAAYEMGRFADAIATWQQALKELDPKADPIVRALILNHLSLAHQQLGQLQIAEDEITQSLKWLNQSPPTTAHREVFAKVLNTQGQLLWSQGKTEPALKTWQTAEQQYRQAQDRTGQLLAQLNQAKALQALGLHTQAVQQLQTLYQQLQQSEAAELQAAGLLYLGDALLRIGQLEKAATILQQGADLADQPSLQAAAILARGNVEQALGERAKSIGQDQQAQAYDMQAVQSYQQVLQRTDARQDSLDAQLNLLHLLPQMGRRSEALALWPSIQEKLVNLPPGRFAIDARLNAVQGLICLDQAERSPDCGARLSSVTEGTAIASVSLARLEPILKVAIDQAQTLQDPIAKSYSMGLLGHLYELTGQASKAQSLTRQALLQLEAIQAPDIAYRWHWQLGRLLVRQGQSKEATISYQAATQALENVRRDLLRTDPNTQFAFRDSVEPVYRQYVALLLGTGQQGAPSPEALKLAIQEIDALQLSELENFLGCDLSAFAANSSDAIDPSAAILYPILLPDRIAMIYNIPGRSLAYKETLIAQTEVEATVATLRDALTQPSQTPEVLTAAQQLYQWLIKPIESELEQSQIKTLVFAADDVLRNIPMGVLYDGQEYLIEKGYSSAVAPRLGLFRSQPSSQPLRMMSGGVSLSQTINGVSFPAIAQVQKELALIPERIRARQPLLDRDFTKANIADQLRRGKITGIHWKTHGVFSSDPAETYLVAYQEQINAADLDQLIQAFLSTQATPLELLILSACQTAQGDRRAVLGMAGVAVRAGARSTLSTLWQANDDATTKLTGKFYELLSQTTMTKAEALRQAQLALLHEEGYAAPHYWGTYLLLGNWR